MAENRFVVRENLDPESFEINDDEKKIKVKLPDIPELPTAPAPNLDILDAFGDPIGKAFADSENA